MLNFDFYNPTRILFGQGRIADLTMHLPKQARVLLLYGGGSIKSNGVYAQVSSALKDFTFLEFGGIEPNPSYETLMRAVELVHAEKIDFLLAVGGGSVIDGTKFIAAASLLDNADPWSILQQRGKNVSAALPMACVLTLPATGSETNHGAVITRLASQEKLAFSSEHCYPQFAILDPSTSFSLPVRQVANGVVDAFVHTIEQYLTYPSDAPIQDRFAESLLQTLIEEGPKALAQPQDYAVRANIMWCACLALNGLIGAGVPQDWATHMLGHELTALHGLDHAQSLAVVLPAMLNIRKTRKHAKLVQFASRVWGLNSGSEDERIATAIAQTRAFFEQMGTPTRLSAYQLDTSHIPGLLNALETHRMTRLGEHRDVDISVSKQVFEAAL